MISWRTRRQRGHRNHDAHNTHLQYVVASGAPVGPLRIHGILPGVRKYSSGYLLLGPEMVESKNFGYSPESLITMSLAVHSRQEFSSCWEMTTRFVSVGLNCIAQIAQCGFRSYKRNVYASTPAKSCRFRLWARVYTIIRGCRCPTCRKCLGLRS